MLQTAIEAARLAGLNILERYPGKRKLTVKGYRDLVTSIGRTGTFDGIFLTGIPAVLPA